MTQPIPAPRPRGRRVAVALAVPVLGWALLARPGAATVQARDNLIRGIEPTGPAVAGSAPVRGCSPGSPAG